MDCSPQSSSVHGIPQARRLEWVTGPFSRGSSQPRDRTCVSCMGRWILNHWATRERHHTHTHTHTVESYSVVKKRIKQCALQQQGWTQRLSHEGSQGKTNTMRHHLDVESELRPKWKHLRNRKRLAHTESQLGVVKEEGVEGEIGSLRFTDTHHGVQHRQAGPTVCHGALCWTPCNNLPWRRIWERADIYIYISVCVYIQKT